jgi:hypothetical protein
MAEVYGEVASKRLPDATWLADAGLRGWVVLHKDKAIARLRGGQPGPELAALLAAGVRAFCLMSAQMSASDEAARFLREKSEIERIANSHAGPCVYGLYAHEMRCLWPVPGR